MPDESDCMSHTSGASPSSYLDVGASTMKMVKAGTNTHCFSRMRSILVASCTNKLMIMATRVHEYATPSSLLLCNSPEIDSFLMPKMA
ncbi:hypothetical protein KIN20_006642 [Parelaphostrongylus tenuis]|uniref:Uncharacterized protein n=1 Tax=Parelaphostrongylus tenuis TaxID=148309 RepID=A0AAD5MNA8_PARTN|nr:hypothetical protein KIN20_006642 [Parelaphostrongylus tenuis]